MEAGATGVCPWGSTDTAGAVAGAAAATGAAGAAAGREGMTLVRHLLWTNFLRMRCRPGPASIWANLEFISSAMSLTNLSV